MRPQIHQGSRRSLEVRAVSTAHLTVSGTAEDGGVRLRTEGTVRGEDSWRPVPVRCSELAIKG